QVGSILDVGTGSGVIALMLAQRTPASVTIDAVEISDDIHQAAENFNASPGKQRLRALHMPVQDLDVQVAYDLVVTNPPYYANALKPPDPARQRARHDRSLRHEEIVTIASRLLAQQGSLSLVLPSDAGLAFEPTAARYGLYSSRVCVWHSTPAKP